LKSKTWITSTASDSEDSEDEVLTANSKLGKIKQLLFGSSKEIDFKQFEDDLIEGRV
jgi:hypothetical protein